MIYTGYFSKIKDFTDQKNIVSISVSNPKWIYIDKMLKELAPTYKLLNDFRNDKITESDYVKQFNDMLNKLDAKKIYNELHALSPNPIITCHCGTKHFCHRHLVAEWLQTKLNIKIAEYKQGNISRFEGRIVPSDNSTQLKLL